MIKVVKGLAGYYKAIPGMECIYIQCLFTNSLFSTISIQQEGNVLEKCEKWGSYLVLL